jgi:hypothetical protein
MRPRGRQNPAETGTSFTCGRPTALSPDPLQNGVSLGLRLGPLWFRGFVRGATTAIIPGPPPSNLLAKVLIEHVPGTGTVKLTGASCVTGSLLRFCYEPCVRGKDDVTTVPSTRQVAIPLRSIVMSGMAVGTVVVEANSTSGAKNQATHALDHQKRCSF